VTKVDFYVVSPGSRLDRFRLACRVAEKARRSGHRVLIHVPSTEEARHLDRLLWIMDDQSFIPHCRVGEGEPELNPIQIGEPALASEEHDVLVNLAGTVPEGFARFQRLLECVDNDPEARAASRERYRFYRDRGYPLDLHEIT